MSFGTCLTQSNLQKEKAVRFARPFPDNTYRHSAYAETGSNPARSRKARFRGSHAFLEQSIYSARFDALQEPARPCLVYGLTLRPTMSCGQK